MYIIGQEPRYISVSNNPCRNLADFDVRRLSGMNYMIISFKFDTVCLEAGWLSFQTLISTYIVWLNITECVNQKRRAGHGRCGTQLLPLSSPNTNNQNKKRIIYFTWQISFCKLSVARKKGVLLWLLNISISAPFSSRNKTISWNNKFIKKHAIKSSLKQF